MRTLRCPIGAGLFWAFGCRLFLARFFSLFVGGPLLRRAQYVFTWWFSGWPSLNFRSPPRAGLSRAGCRDARASLQFLVCIVGVLERLGPTVFFRWFSVFFTRYQREREREREREIEIQRTQPSVRSRVLLTYHEFYISCFVRDR